MIKSIYHLISERKHKLTLVFYMGYFDYLVYMGGGGGKKAPCLILAFDF